MKRYLWTLLMLVVPLAGCPTGADKSATPPINPAAAVIGMLQPLATGSALEKELAARLAIGEINAAGGVNGQPLDLRVGYDNNNNPAFGVPSAQDLVANGVLAIIGANSSAVTLPVAQQVTIPANIALLSPGATSPLITTLVDNNTVYRIPPSDALQGRLLAELVFGEGHSVVATFAQDEPYGAGLTQAFTQRFQQLGGTIKASVVAPVSQTSGYASQITTLYTGGAPPVLMMFAFSQPTAALLREILSAKGALPVLYGVDANMIPDTLNNAPPQIAGMRGTTPAANTSTPQYQHFLAAYSANVGSTPDPNTENAYDAVYLLALAMAQSGSNTRAGVLASLHDVSESNTASTVIGPGGFVDALAAIKAGKSVAYLGASGPINFDANGDPTAATYQYLEVEMAAGNRLSLATLRTINYNP